MTFANSVYTSAQIRDFPADYGDYLTRRDRMVVSELQCNVFTRELMDAYRKNLPPFCYWALRQFQAQPDTIPAVLGVAQPPRLPRHSG